MRALALGALGLSWVLLAAAAAPQEASLTKEQQEVWSREEAYRNAVQSRDANAFVALWHEDFVGWPYFEQESIRKSDIRKAPFRNSGNAVETYEVARKAVQIFGDTAVVHYLATVNSKRSDGRIDVRVVRITHTWKKTGGVWLIIGGMSSRVEPSGPSK
jgi:ketosteroid isomerase-like protein